MAKPSSIEDGLRRIQRKTVPSTYYLHFFSLSIFHAQSLTLEFRSSAARITSLSNSHLRRLGWPGSHRDLFQFAIIVRIVHPIPAVDASDAETKVTGQRLLGALQPLLGDPSSHRSHARRFASEQIEQMKTKIDRHLKRSGYT